MNKVTAMTSPISSSRDPPENALKKPMPMSMPLINQGIGRLIISNTESPMLTAGAQVLMIRVSRLDGCPCAQERTGNNGGGVYAINAAWLGAGCARVGGASGVWRGFDEQCEQRGGSHPQPHARP